MLHQVVLLGGTFDPIHMGHLQMARSSQAHCMADEVWFIPSGQPWQKSQIQTPASHRLAMTQLAIEGAPSWKVNDCEVNRQGPTYTIDTLELLTAQYPDTQFTLVLGADQLRNLCSWHCWQHLFDHVRIGVVERGGHGDLDIPKALAAYEQQGRVFRVPMPMMTISSTDIRHNLLHRQNPIADIAATARQRLINSIPEKVRGYIEENNLYCGKLVSD